MTQTIINGQLLAASEALVSVQDRGFRYGDGVFETIAVEAGVPYQFDWHMTRLAGGLSAIKIPFDTAGLRSYCRQLLNANKIENGILRLQITRGIGSRGYLPVLTYPPACGGTKGGEAHEVRPAALQPSPPSGATRHLPPLAGEEKRVTATFVIETSPLPAISNAPVALWQSSYAKLSAHALPVRYKLCQGLNSTLARMEAAEHHCAEALMLNERGQLCETAAGNLFWFKNGSLYTPSLNCGILEGATRAAVMRLSPYPVCEVETGIEALTQAEAVFITNTVWKALAVGQLLPLRQQWNSEAITAQFRQLLEKDRDNYCRTHRAEWQ